MKEKSAFQKKIYEILKEIGSDTLHYNASEFWMLEGVYRYVERYAMENQLYNTSIALPLVRGLFNGKYRKATVVRRDGVICKLPYMIHCLMVCRMLIDLQIPLTKKEEDIVLASALCHDVIEDISFEQEGRELVSRFHLDEMVYDIVKLVSKRKDFTEEEHRLYFQHIQENPYALLVKLSDRGNNVEDLYNMSLWKAHEYVGETRTYFFPMCDYAMEYYPNLTDTFLILREKMATLTEATEILVTRYEKKESRLLSEIEELQEENRRLREELKKWEDEDEEE